MAAPELSDRDLAEIQRRALKRLRERRVGGRDEPSQKEIAERVGYSDRHYGGIERGETDLAREHLVGLMRAYGVSASHIYERLRDAAREVEAEKAREAQAGRYGSTRSDQMVGELPRSPLQALEESFDVRVWLQNTDDGMLVLSWLPGGRSR